MSTGGAARPAAGPGPRRYWDVLALDLAIALRDAGLRWTPAPGDRFVLPHRGMDDDVFVLADMTVEVHEFPGGRVLGFNGVTEWALDSVEQHEAVWLPAEHQLRDLLGGLFRRLEATAPAGTGTTSTPGYAVTLALPAGEAAFEAAAPVDAYARALLAVLRDVGSGPT